MTTPGTYVRPVRAHPGPSAPYQGATPTTTSGIQSEAPTRDRPRSAVPRGEARDGGLCRYWQPVTFSSTWASMDAPVWPPAASVTDTVICTGPVLDSAEVLEVVSTKAPFCQVYV